MEIKARICKRTDVQCTCCTKDRKQVLDMFEVAIPNGNDNTLTVLRLCDECIDKLFIKTLKCNCYTNHRVKDKRDIQILNKRNIDRYVNVEKIPINPPVQSKKHKELDEWEKIIEEYGE